MRRRAILAALATLGTGCVSAPGSPGAVGGTDADTEYRIGDLTVSTDTDTPVHRYVVKARAFYSADAVQRERDSTTEDIVVTDITDIDDPAVRDAIVTAADDGAYRTDTLPTDLRTRLERTDFFTGFAGDHTWTHIGFELYELHPDRPPAIEFDAELLDAAVAPHDPGTLEFRLTNTGATTQELFSGTVPPFGVVGVEEVDTEGEFLLWRPYTEQGCVTFTDRGVVVCSIGVLTEIAPGDVVRRRYDILPSTTDHHPDHTVPPGPGRYRLTDDLSYSTGTGAPESTLSATVEFTLDPA